MKFAFIADIHLSGYTNDKIVNQLPERLNSIKNVLYDIAEYCIENGIMTIIIGGDTLHGKSIIHAVAQGIMLDYFRYYKDKIQFIVIDGNHDLSGKGKDAVSALKSIDNEPNVIRYKEPTHISSDIFLVPWSYNMIDAIKNNKSKILISHFGLNEGMLNNGMSIIADISLSDLTGKYEYVFLGHYHKPQSIIRDDISLYYVGSPIQMDWGEKNEDKRFIVFDTNGPNNSIIVESIPTKGYTKYVELKITEDNIKDIIELTNKIKSEGHYVNIVKTDKVDTSKYDDKYNIIDKSEKDITNRGVNTSMTMTEKLKAFLEIKEIPKDEIDNYMKLGLEIIEESIK